MPLFNPEPAITNWSNLSPINGWISHSNVLFPPPGYCRDDESKIVGLRGILANGTIGQTTFILPPGFRPTYRLVFPVLTYSSSTIVLGQAAIDPAGDVIAIAGGNTVFTLNGIFFRTDQ